MLDLDANERAEMAIAMLAAMANTYSMNTSNTEWIFFLKYGQY